jgi:hypothetical protein
MRMITVIEAVSQASIEIGLAQRAISAAVGSPDQDIAQMVGLLSAVADEVTADPPYAQTLGDGYWLMTNDGTSKRSYPQADNDIILFDGRLAINGLKFRFLKAKGLEFGEELADFAKRLNKLAARANQRVLDLDVEGSRVQ